jgi:hypothetical protein
MVNNGFSSTTNFTTGGILFQGDHPALDGGLSLASALQDGRNPLDAEPLQIHGNGPGFNRQLPFKGE